MNRNEILDQLRQGVCTVNFTKVNGDNRVMECTLRSDLIPEHLLPTRDHNLMEENSDVVRVYDTKAEGWRSFLISNLLSFGTSEG